MSNNKNKAAYYQIILQQKEQVRERVARAWDNYEQPVYRSNFNTLGETRELPTSQIANWLSGATNQTAALSSLESVPETKDVKMATDLMALVNECSTPTALVEVNKIQGALAMAERLDKLGFKKAASPIGRKALAQQRLQVVIENKFIAVKPEKIKSFLNRLASEYNLKYGVDKLTKTDKNYGEDCSIAYTIHRSFTRGVGYFKWEEVATEQYAGIPPESVLARFEDVQRKKLFDSYTVATVGAVKDPLLLGRILGCDDRFFIAQWGDDVSLDDVI